MKTILFVTYGGGHVRMVVPVIRALADDPGVRVVTLALTTAGPVLDREGLPYLGFKDFLRDDDVVARKHGAEFATTMHNPESGIALQETIAYLGLSYQDLVERYSAAEAAQMWTGDNRHVFVPLTVLRRVIDRIKPDLVVTTNSPRAERAALEVARAEGIPTLAMVDLFAFHHFYTLVADHFTVLSPKTVDNLIEGGVDPDSTFYVAGNPAFDVVFDHGRSINETFRAQHLPCVGAGARLVLWIDAPGIWNLEKAEVHRRTDAEIVRDLDDLAAAVRTNDAHLLIRPHPSQQRGLYEQWLKDNPDAPAHFAGDVPLHPLLTSVDAVVTYRSTVGIEALLLQRPVIQLRYETGKTELPLAEWGVAFEAPTPADLPRLVHQALFDGESWRQMQARALELLPQEKAAPKIAAHIRQILAGNGAKIQDPSGRTP